MWETLLIWCGLAAKWSELGVAFTLGVMVGAAVALWFVIAVLVVVS